MEFIIEHGNGIDTQFKSPDETLKRAPNAKVLATLAEAQGRILQLQEENRSLRQRYNSEINEWKEYEKRVAEWKNLILKIVHQLKKEADSK